ncbi:hypothetical protein CALCODRAFT_503803 [Calocera cornea HHB12733]|uniref:N-acetyltransferase domain-containing protein n=1 Tax=Calocera cornea HHB12733 TaxID=1353952 RepID=A0A165CQD0_9BASI|nr:hypothetical protein CALCODRAFT_503803 [Calocera cornea HHB12733]
MCDDLIATHFFVSSKNGSTDILKETTHERIFSNNAPLNVLWTFVPPSLDFTEAAAWLKRHHPTTPPQKGFDRWTVNTYNKDLAFQVFQDAAWSPTWLELLYEMRLSDSPPTSSTNSCPVGFRVRGDPTFYKALDPDHTGEDFLRAEETITIIEETTDQVAGSMKFLVDHTLKRIYISGLEVIPSYRRRGLATALVHESFRWTTKGYTIWLTCFAQNTGAVTMYFGLGFLVNRCLWGVGGGGRSPYP